MRARRTVSEPGPPGRQPIVLRALPTASAGGGAPAMGGWVGLAPQKRGFTRRLVGPADVKPATPSGEDHAFRLAPAGAWQDANPVPQARRGLATMLDEAPAAATAFLEQVFDLTSPATWVLDKAVVPPLRPTEPSPAGLIAWVRMNDIRGLNRFLMRANNRLLGRSGMLAVRVTTLEQELDDMRRASSSIVTFALRYAGFFFTKRLLPKMKASRYLYFALTGGRNRAISITEALGRLVYCGFALVETREIDGVLYIIARRDAEPARTAEPSYWPIFRMRRIGKDGNVIGVYKLRTMFPYADTLQGYVYERNNLADGGKLQADFRVTEWGRVFRRLWIDELPMLINWAKGDLKFVGVRPLSHHFASLYPAEFFEYRTRFKPGLVPPFYADLPRTFEEIVASEKRYLEAYVRSPWLTDLRYLSRSLYNMIFRGVRSR